ncbi:hypothetical protein [Lacinutrix sp. MEBiC02404]
MKNTNSGNNTNDDKHHSPLLVFFTDKSIETILLFRITLSIDNTLLVKNTNSGKKLILYMLVENINTSNNIPKITVGEKHQQ